MKATKFIQPGNNTLWLFDGYPAISVGYQVLPWLRAMVSGKAIVSHYIRERVDPAQNFTTYHGGYAVSLEFGKGAWRVRPDFNDYWGVTHYTLQEEPINFRARCLGISALYRPPLRD
jgi:hypothetical protein